MPRLRALMMICSGFSPAGGHCSDACPPRPRVVASNPVRPSSRVTGLPAGVAPREIYGAAMMLMPATAVTRAKSRRVINPKLVSFFMAHHPFSTRFWKLEGSHKNIAFDATCRGRCLYYDRYSMVPFQGLTDMPTSLGLGARDPFVSLTRAPIKSRTKLIVAG